MQMVLGRGETRFRIAWPGQARRAAMAQAERASARLLREEIETLFAKELRESARMLAVRNFG